MWAYDIKNVYSTNDKDFISCTDINIYIENEYIIIC